MIESALPVVSSASTMTPLRRGLSRAVSKRGSAERNLVIIAAVHADHAVIRSSHADIGDVRRASRQHPLVSGLHVRVRPDHDGGASIEMPIHRDFL